MHVPAFFRILLPIGLALVLARPAWSASESVSPADLVGTWQLVSTRYGDETRWRTIPAEEHKLKFITPGRFVWVAHGADGKVTNAAGGTYTLSGDTYIEVIEFGDEDMIKVRGQQQVFSLRLDGDTLHQEGQLSNGFKIREVWQRAK